MHESSPALKFLQGTARDAARLYQQGSGTQINAEALFLGELSREAAAHSLALSEFNPPAISAVTPLELGVHRTEDISSGLPPYVRRSIDKDLLARLSRAPKTGEMVLIVGDSTAGKTRAAYEALTATFPEGRVFFPADGSELVGSFSRLLDCKDKIVLWLDNLEKYIGPDGLTPTFFSILRQRRVPILATMRAERYRRLHPALQNDSTTDTDKHGHTSSGVRILEQVDPILLSRLWSNDEIARARTVDDRRVTNAVAYSSLYGIAEYLAAGPRLYQEWALAWGPGENPRGAAIVAAAIDCARMGITEALDAALLTQMHEAYLSRVGGALLRPESLEEGFQWATRRRFGVTSLLLPASSADEYRVFDYLPDAVERASEGAPIPRESWLSALDYTKESRAQLFRIGMAAKSHAEPEFTERAWRESAGLGSAPAALNLGRFYRVAGEKEKALAAWEKAADMGSQQASTHLGFEYEKDGNLEEAITHYQKAADAGDMHALEHLAWALAGDPKAEEHWLRLIENDTDGSYHYALAHHYRSRKELELAEEWYEKAIELGDSDSMNELAILMVDKGDQDSAGNWFARSAEAGNTRGVLNLALFKYSQGDIASADEILTTSYEGGEFQATTLLGVIRYQGGEKSEAKSLWLKGLEEGVEDNLLKLAAFQEDEGDFEGARSYYEKAADAGLPIGRFKRAEYLLDDNRYQEARDLFVSVIDDLDAEDICDFARHLLRSLRDFPLTPQEVGRYIEDAKHWHRSAMDQGHAHSGCCLGQMLLHEGKLPEAEAAFRWSYKNGHEHAAEELSKLMAAMHRGGDAAHWARLAQGVNSTRRGRSKRSGRKRKRR